MNKYLKYLNWVPFGISIGALLLYLRYTIMFKLDSNLVMTDAVKETLNQYLIVLFVSLFVGLVIILFKKVLFLVHSSDNNKELIKNKIDNEEKISNINDIDEKFRNAIENNSRLVNIEESNFIRDIKSNKVVRVRLAEPIVGNSVKAKVIDTDEDIEILLLDDDMDILQNRNINSQINDGIKCPKCNSILDKDAIICTHCGILINKEKITELLNLFNDSKEPKISNNYEVKEKQKHTGNNVFVSFLINFIIIVLCIFLIFLIGNKIINQSEENHNKISMITE